MMLKPTQVKFRVKGGLGVTKRKEGLHRQNPSWREPQQQETLDPLTRLPSGDHAPVPVPLGRVARKNTADQLGLNFR